MEDDTYGGYFIPAGCDLIANQWYVIVIILRQVLAHLVGRAILHDEEEYPEPFVFKPERWILKEGQREPMHPDKVAFGFGRR